MALLYLIFQNASALGIHLILRCASTVFANERNVHYYSMKSTGSQYRLMELY